MGDEDKDLLGDEETGSIPLIPEIDEDGAEEVPEEDEDDAKVDDDEGDEDEI